MAGMISGGACPLLLIPGMMCDARLFLPQIAALSAQRMVIVADITGAETMAELASAVLANAPPRFALAGLSMGGIVAMEMLHQQPDRIERIALLNTNPRAETPEIRAGRIPQMKAALEGKMMALMETVMFPRYSADGEPDITMIAAAMARDLGPKVFVRQSLALAGRADRSETLRGSQIPTMILGGTEDQLCPPERHEYMAQLMPHASLTMLDGSAHLTTLERPAETCAAMRDWLEAP